MLQSYCRELGRPPIDPKVFSLAIRIFFDLTETVDTSGRPDDEGLDALLGKAKDEIKRKVC
jgi:hypothetical protein